MIGRILSNYEVLEEIGRGGMGIVYRARDLKLEREVALKVLPAELMTDPERRRRFVLEAKAAAALNHPHIGTIHEIDEAERTTFIAMELIQGGKLSDYVSKAGVLDQYGVRYIVATAGDFRARGVEHPSDLEGRPGLELRYRGPARIRMRTIGQSSRVRLRFIRSYTP